MLCALVARGPVDGHGYGWSQRYAQVAPGRQEGYPYWRERGILQKPAGYHHESHNDFLPVSNGLATLVVLRTLSSHLHRPRRCFRQANLIILASPEIEEDSKEDDAGADV